tara:strand:+ start:812 stop:2086 length:1275 start_codon:yes stop_codon:yes gene_type:complete
MTDISNFQTLTSTFNLAAYADIGKVVTDEEYAKSKSLIVKHIGNKHLIKYDKSKVTRENTDTLGLFRSIITDGKKIISFAPPKSYNSKDEEWMQNPNKYFRDDPTENYNFVIENYYEGTMINVFWDEDLKDWNIATRSNIGGRCKYFKDSEHTFRYLYLDAINKMEEYENDYSASFENLDKNFSYSFVLQHPKNRLVIPFQQAKLILVGKYESLDNWEVKAYKEVNKNSIVTQQYIKDHFNEETIQSAMTNQYKLVGWMIYNGATRFKVRNPTYEKVRQLKGNNPKLEFQFHELRKNNKIIEYLYYFPEHKETFNGYWEKVKQFTNSLYQNYVKCYIQHQKPLKEFPYQFRGHMFNIHQIYLADLKPKNLYVKWGFVKNYINDLPSARLMYSVNYEMRNVERDNAMEKDLEKQHNLEEIDFNTV